MTDINDKNEEVVDMDEATSTMIEETSDQETIDDMNNVTNTTERSNPQTVVE